MILLTLRTILLLLLLAQRLGPPPALAQRPLGSATRVSLVQWKYIGLGSVLMEYLISAIWMARRYSPESSLSVTPLLASGSATSPQWNPVLMSQQSMPTAQKLI